MKQIIQFFLGSILIIGLFSFNTKAERFIISPEEASICEGDSCQTFRVTDTQGGAALQIFMNIHGLPGIPQKKFHFVLMMVLVYPWRFAEGPILVILVTSKVVILWRSILFLNLRRTLQFKILPALIVV